MAPAPSSLDRFLSAVYGGHTTLAGLIDELGFEPAQAQRLCGEHLPVIAAAFVEAVRKKLTRGDLDLWFRVLNRRYGLDGEPPLSLEETAAALQVDLDRASQAQSDALQKCRYKTTQAELKRELHRIALEQLKHGGEQPGKEAVAGKLKRLADLRAAVDVTRMDYEAKRAEVLQKVQAELDALEAEYQPLLDAADDNASQLESEIKNDVLLTGQSVMTDVYQAIYMKGRIAWDNDGLGRYAQQHPELLKYRKQGDPSVSLRTVKK